MTVGFIIGGWRIKQIAELSVDIPELNNHCEKHNLKHKFIVGKKYELLYFIPLNYFWAKERIFKTCAKCTSDYNEVPPNYEKVILNFYHDKISSKEFHTQIKYQMEEYKNQAKAINKKHEENDEKFWKMMVYFISFLVLLLIIKFILF